MPVISITTFVIRKIKNEMQPRDALSLAKPKILLVKEDSELLSDCS